ncbi:uncharacterized protein LOC124413359 [Diprion similis]|uniref:uncharacterized protein LOC124413359 n=1 Tax=Diprion similis TaxID=362088 RepID=UPI001EF979F2|nr:uncharacterized protein LOC124413359 [Diprion similis]
MLTALNICFDASIFKFNDSIYSQTFGLPMGSPLSPILADIVMDELESCCIKKLPFTLPIYYRYVDDILTAVPTQSVDLLLNTFNGFHPRLKFTVETELNNTINFLDITIINDSSTIATNWFQKPTWSQRYLNFKSHYPRSYKIGTIINLVDRAINLSNECYHTSNLNLISDVLIKNDYPPGLLHKVISRRVSQISHSDTNSTPNLGENNNIQTFISIPYVAGLFENLNRTFKKYNVRFVGKNVNDLRRWFDSGKDSLPFDKQSNKVYKISCIDCGKPYIGQSSRCLNTRLNEHKNNCKDSEDHQTALTKHALNLQHQFDFDNVKILHIEPRYYNRLLLEMCNIVSSVTSINLRQDIEHLSDVYVKLISNSRSNPNGEVGDPEEKTKEINWLD